MKNLKIASVQFENLSGNKDYNLSVIEGLVADAARAGAEVVSFHECSVTGYTFARNLDRDALLQIAEFVPGGPSVTALTALSRKYKVTILAGLFEKDKNDAVYNTYICVNETGLVARHRKLHPFINANLSPGDSYTVFTIKGWTCGILICYDNNVIENVRATALLGADVLFMPHVTMCTPSPRPGAGFVDADLWRDKEKNENLLRAEFDGDKGRRWLMKWLPARAYDNGIFVVFSNPIGMDDDQLKNGCSMVIDPFGEIIAECSTLHNEFVIAELSYDMINRAGGRRYRNARRPALYRNIIALQHDAEQRVAWLDKG